MRVDDTDIVDSVERNAGLLFDRALLPNARSDMLRADFWRAQPESERGGRGTVWMVQGEFGRGVLRHYRRGGMAAKLSRDTYLWQGPERTRSFAEFRLLLRLRELGLPVPRPLLAGYRRVSPVGYRADLLMSQIENAHSLAEQISSGVVDERRMAELGHLLSRFHRLGVDHADLNAHNLLFDGDGRWWVIDFDRGRIRVPQGAWVERRLQRLRRSIGKLMSRDVGRADQLWRALCAAHHQAAPELSAPTPDRLES